MITLLKERIRSFRCLLIRISSLLLARPFSFQEVSNIVILAPHPDDEILGCGDLIQHLLSEGNQVDVVILSGGEKSHAGCCEIDEERLMKERRKLSRKAAEIVGLPLEHLYFLDYPDGGITFHHAETERLKALIESLNPETLFVPHQGEGWSDHLQTREIGIRLASESTSVYEYCVWFWYYNSWQIDWKHARILKMTLEEQTIKNKAIDAYILPKAPCGKPWSGVLPKVFVEACRWKKELYFKLK